MFKKLVKNISADEMPVIIRNAICIILISSIIGFIVNLYHPDGFILVSKKSGKNKTIILLSSEEAKIKKDSNSAIFIDSRTDEEFEISHIPGSVNIPAVPDPESKINEFKSAIFGEKELVIYCDGIECGSSQILAYKLINMGYLRHIYIIKNGIPEWQEKGFPVEGKSDQENDNNE